MINQIDNDKLIKSMWQIEKIYIDKLMKSMIIN